MQGTTINRAEAQSLPSWRLLLQYRSYIQSNALQDFVYKYAGTSLGLMWNVIHPIMLVAVFSFVFTVIMPARFQPSGGQTIPFILFLCSGLLPWLSFVDALLRGTGAFVDNAGYLRKLSIPEEVFLARTLVGSCILLCINLVVLIAAAFLYGFWPRWTWLLVPVVGLLMMLFAFGMGALLGTINVFARDAHQIVTISTQAWLWLTPITYASTAMPSWLHSAQYANPAFPYIELIREQFIYGRPGPISLWIAALLWAVAALAAGNLVLSRFRTDVRDVL
ncbi:ABC transporter permease [Bosea massiliensis]|uniref:Transport permease protein n=1 Tax=Bosea massiliensis TaxID=151419 RepID=A0ABW0PB02_9HYPH